MLVWFLEVAVKYHNFSLFKLPSFLTVSIPGNALARLGVETGVL